MKRFYINNQIRAREVRLIDETGKNLGVVSFEEAGRIAQERKLDLIQMTQKVLPPICKLGDFGKFQYWQAKKEKEMKKKQKGGETKGIRLGFAISEHDLEVRAAQAEKFLKGGNRVRVEMMLRGREKSMQYFARQKFNHLLDLIKIKIGIKVEQDIKWMFGRLIMIITKE